MLKKKTPDELQKITAELVAQLRNLLHDDVYQILLYGSYARGDADAESDIDIMLILNCDSEKTRSYRQQVSNLTSDIGLLNDVLISAHLCDKANFQKREAFMPFYRNVRQEGVKLYG